MLRESGVILRNKYSLFRVFAILAFAFAFEIGFATPVKASDDFMNSEVPSDISLQEIEEITDSSSAVAPSLLSTDSYSLDSFVQNFSGETRFDTSSMQALSAYSSSEYVIVVADGGWPDALCATGLAGVLDCPILLTSGSSLSPQTADAIRKLGATRAVTLGGELVMSARVKGDLESLGLKVDRLAGETRQDTQMMVYEYGKRAPRGRTWSTDAVAFASGARFHDALSFSPVAYAERAPIFLTDASGNLNSAQKSALRGRAFASSVVLGGPIVTSSDTVSFAGSVSSSGKATVLAGDTRFDTSALVARWAVDSRGFKWDNAAFTTAELPYDALSGSVLQGRDRSVVLLVADGSSPTVTELASHKGSVSRIRFFGGYLSVSEATRSQIVSVLTNILFVNQNISFKSLLDIETAYLNRLPWTDSMKQEHINLLPTQLNPSSWAYGTKEFNQFAKLDGGRSGLSADQLNSFIATNGAGGALSGKGQAFIDAANTYGVNDVYLLSHAILESAWGKSELAKGFVYDGATEVDGKLYPAGTYYNFFGIGAVDSGPLSGGRAMAVKMGWNSPEKAITGAAQWIKSNYLSKGQNTLYFMKWDLANAISSGTVWHQYATSVTWATGIARVMGDCFAYAGVNPYPSGMKFILPQYR